MRGTLQAMWLLPLALGSALPAREEKIPEKRSFDLSGNALAGLGSIKQDLMASGAAINQQLYQAVAQPAQYKTCNPANVHIRQEWYAQVNLSTRLQLICPGRHSPRRRKRRTSVPSSV